LFSVTDTECSVLRSLPGTGPFYGLLIYERLIYYSDWGSHSVSVFNPDTGSSQSVASGLMRPTRFFIHYLRNITGKHGLNTAMF